MKIRNFFRAMLAGLLGTGVMILLGIAAGRMGAPFLNWGETLASYTGSQAWTGYLLFMLGGLFIAFLYENLCDRLPGHSWYRGVFYAVVIWLITGACLAPILKLGFFMNGILISLGTLILYLVYGAILGWVYES